MSSFGESPPPSDDEEFPPPEEDFDDDFPPPDEDELPDDYGETAKYYSLSSCLISIFVVDPEEMEFPDDEDGDDDFPPPDDDEENPPSLGNVLYGYLQIFHLQPNSHAGEDEFNDMDDLEEGSLPPDEDFDESDLPPEEDDDVPAPGKDNYFRKYVDNCRSGYRPR